MSIFSVTKKLSLGLLFGISFIANADKLTAEQIVKKAELASYYAGDDGRTAARMMIVDSQGRKQLRQFTILRKDSSDGGSQDLLVFFSRPSDVRNTVFRVVKNTQAEDDRWLYLPDLDLVKRISSGDKRTSFVGSHFFYEDVSGRNTSQDSFELKSEDQDNYYLAATPKNPDSVEFSRYDLTVSKATFLPMLIKFYDANNKHYRTVESLSVKPIQGIPTVAKSKITDLKNQGYTLMEFRYTKYNIGLPQDLFSERSLRNPPLKWLKR